MDEKIRSHLMIIIILLSLTLIFSVMLLNNISLIKDTDIKTSFGEGKEIDRFYYNGYVRIETPAAGNGFTIIFEDYKP
jgi:hypothetical protein